MRQSTILLISSFFALFAAAAAGFLAGDVAWIWGMFLGLGVLGIATWVTMEAKGIKQFFSKRTTHYGLNSLFTVLIVLVIVVVLNLVAKSHDWKKDLTKNKLHTLSEQTEKVVKALTQEVRIRGFVHPNTIGEFQKVFEKYTSLSPKLKSDFIDVDKDPGAVQRYDIKQPGVVIVESGDRSSKLDNLMGPDDPKFEEKLTNAIISVTKGQRKLICYSSGHGEKLFSDTSPNGYSEMKDLLEAGRFTTREIILATEGIPGGCEVVVIAGPRSDPTPAELTTLEGSIKKGGKVLLMLEPDSSEKWKGFLAKFGVAWKPAWTVLEMDPRLRPAGGDPSLPVVVNYDQTHEITKAIRQPTLYSFPTPVEKEATVPPGMTVSTVFSSSGSSYEIGYNALKNSKNGIQVKGLRKGPITLALSVTGKAESAEAPKAKDPKDAKGAEPLKDKNDGEFRLLVVGDANFASNELRRNWMNSDLFQNMLSWLSKEEDLIAIRPKEAGASELRVTDFNAKVIMLASFVAPFGMWIFGVVVWLRRRRK